MKTQPLTISTLRSLADKDKIETVIVGMVDHYGRLMGKRADVYFFLDHISHSGTHVCDYLLTTDMEMEPVQGYESANWQKGYGDYHLIPDLSTLRQASWLKRTAIVICDVYSADHQPLSISPRQILKKQLHRLKELGYTANSAHELEYYLFKNNYAEAAEKKYHHLQPSGWYIEDYHLLQGSRVEEYTARVRKHLKRSGIPVETSKGEWGLGQHEINIKYADALEMADRHVLYKQCMKEIADQQELSVTFMAKYREDQAGSSCHVHFNLLKNGQNVFCGSEEVGPIKCSQTFQHFLAGCIQNVSDVMPWMAPTVNSYKRYISGSWAPTKLAWCYDNRTAGFRVVGHGESLRIECRIPGADCHPYLALAGLIAAGIKGIQDKTPLPAMTKGNNYDNASLKSLPTTLQSATDNMKQAKWLAEAIGQDVIDHYCHFYHTEVSAYQQAVTDWERHRYFERI